ncbi:hypothetical protein [Amycolatopsis methanolica]|uniref:hypothetical protein n=1 Tax=Amycolatopsis methanolica TaxID=1814 RepID=UPI00342594C9
MGVKAKIGSAGAALVVAAGVAWSLGPGLNGLSDDAPAIALGIGVRPPAVAPPAETSVAPPAPEVTRPAPDQVGGARPVNRPGTAVPLVPLPSMPAPAVPGAPGMPAPEVPPSVPQQPGAPSAPAEPTSPATPTPSPAPPPDATPTQPASGCVSGTRLGSLICGIAGVLS